MSYLPPSVSGKNNDNTGSSIFFLWPHIIIHPVDILLKVPIRFQCHMDITTLKTISAKKIMENCNTKISRAKFSIRNHSTRFRDVQDINLLQVYNVISNPSTLQKYSFFKICRLIRSNLS